MLDDRLWLVGLALFGAGMAFGVAVAMTVVSIRNIFRQLEGGTSWLVEEHC